MLSVDREDELAEHGDTLRADFVVSMTEPDAQMLNRAPDYALPPGVHGRGRSSHDLAFRRRSRCGAT
jgi:hypothetical protein